MTSGRAETGPMQFGDDWRGVFIRGDNACYLAMQLSAALDPANGPEMRGHFALQMRELVDLLVGANEFTGAPDVQRLRSFDACAPDDAAERAARGQAWALAEAQGEVAMLRARLATAEGERDRYREAALTSDSDAENAAEAAADGVLAIGAALGREGATAGECVALIEGLRAQVARGDLASLAAREQGEGATFRAWRRGEITTAERDVALRSEGR